MSRQKNRTISMIRCYSELRRLETFEERYDYLALKGDVGRSTFGFDRYLNQRFYKSAQWRRVRSVIITRDLSCDLGVAGFEIHKELYIHHMNPMVISDIVNGESSVLDPDFLITTTHQTHNAIHYGDKNLLAKPFVERKPGDTKLWLPQGDVNDRPYERARTRRFGMDTDQRAGLGHFRLLAESDQGQDWGCPAV